jgi:hypothetical protein
VRIIALVQRSRAKVREVRGKPTDVARELLREGKLDEVAALVDALAARNSQLELLVAALKARRNKAEGVSKEQLSLALEELARESCEREWRTHRGAEASSAACIATPTAAESAPR